MKTERPAVFLAAVAVLVLGVCLGCQPESPPTKAQATPPAEAESPPPGDDAPSAGGITWVNKLSDGLKQATEEQKPLMVDFYTDWCSWCKKLDEETYSDAKVAEKAGGFICVKVDAEADTQSAEKYKVEGFPTILFLSASGKELHRVPGFAPAEEFLKEMDKALAAPKPQ